MNIGTTIREAQDLAPEPVKPITDEQIGRYVRAIVEADQAHPLEHPDWERTVIEQVAEWMRT